MTLATLSEVLQPALKDGYAVAGLVCQGWEDSRAYVAAAQAENVPVILQAGPGARNHMPLSVWGEMFRQLGQVASVPVVAHLDHGDSFETCRQAIDCGFTSVMYDGSRLPLQDNIRTTAQIAQMAHDAGVSCEGEIGFVGYNGGEQSAGTDPDEAAEFVRETNIDAMAVSVGNVHLQTNAHSDLDTTRLRAIEARCGVPLVIHGGSGVSHNQRRELAQTSNICKFNIGTELRQAFGAALRQSVTTHPERFDRIEILGATHDPLVATTRRLLSLLKPQG